MSFRAYPEANDPQLGPTTPRLGWHASRLPRKPWEQVRCTGLARRAAVGAMPPKYRGGRGGVRGARRLGAPSVGHRADAKRGNPVRNLRGTSSAAARKFCRVIDACHPSAAALERSPPRYRARWTHVWLIPGATQSTAAVFPWVQGPWALVVFPPLLTSKAGPRPGRPPPGGRASTRRAGSIRPYRLSSSQRAECSETSCRPGCGRSFPPPGGPAPRPRSR